MSVKHLSGKFFCGAIAALLCLCASARGFEALSPDGRLGVKIAAGEKISFSIFLDGGALLENCAISMQSDRGDFGINSRALSEERRSQNAIAESPFAIRSKTPDAFNELEIGFENFRLIFRLYNDAFAYRFAPKGEGEIKILGETLEIPLGGDAECFVHPVGGFNSSFESVYKSAPAEKLGEFKMLSLPLVVGAPTAKIALSDSDVYKYPHMNMRYDAQKKSLCATFAPYPKKLFERHIFLLVEEAEDFIAKRPASEPAPWRVFIAAREDKELLANDAVYRLARPSKIEDVSWIKPGLCAWEWLHCANLEGVDFETGMNETTYKYYMDFAAKYKVPLMLFDAGWLPDYDGISDGETALDIPALIKYGKERGVKSVLWMLARPLNDPRKARAAFERISKWGAAGVKIDFTDRDDQVAVEFFEDTAELAAEFGLMVDFHGCPKPAGLNRTWPNVVNFEGVKGAEFNKFESTITPAHNVSILFTRMLAGPMDYTPGILRNSGFGKKGPEGLVSYLRPVSQGTRSHQAAMYVLYFAPLQMLADSPTEYEKFPQLTKFIADCPTVWDESVPLAGELGKYAAIARRNGETWYVGAMTDWEERELELPLDFLGDGAYAATIVRDTQNSNRLAEDYKIETRSLRKGGVLKVKLSRGGGFAARLEKERN